LFNTNSIYKISGKTYRVIAHYDDRAENLPDKIRKMLINELRTYKRDIAV